MPTPEANFWNTVKRNLPPKCHTTRIENRHGGGVPDAHLSWAGLVFWLELKTTKNNALNLSPHQIAWNTSYCKSGGLSFILVKHLSSGDLILFEGVRAAEVRASGLRESGVTPLYRGRDFGGLWETIRASGFGHLETVLAGLGAQSLGPGPGQPGLEAKEKGA